MRIDFDDEVRAWYLTLRDATVERTIHVSDEVAIDVDAAGAVVGVEFLLAPAELEPEVLQSLLDQFPDVRRALSDIQSLAVA